MKTDYALLKIDTSIKCLNNYVPSDEWEKDRVVEVLTELQEEKNVLMRALEDCEKDTV